MAARILHFSRQATPPHAKQPDRRLDVVVRRLQLVAAWARALSSGERRPLRLRPDAAKKGSELHAR